MKGRGTEKKKREREREKGGRQRLRKKASERRVRSFGAHQVGTEEGHILPSLHPVNGPSSRRGGRGPEAVPTQSGGGSPETCDLNPGCLAPDFSS